MLGVQYLKSRQFSLITISQQAVSAGVTLEFHLKKVCFYQAELIKSDLDKAVQKVGDVEPRRDQPEIRYNVTS